jgi:hypothetical protein
MKFFIIIAVIFTGALFIPTTSYACHKQKSTHTQTSQKQNTTKKSCCDKKADKGCSGKCKHNSCCSTATTQFCTITDVVFEIENPLIYSVKRTLFSGYKTEILSGFTSLWLLPKIK